jgi:REP element-mobilizing transposase RayT
MANKHNRKSTRLSGYDYAAEGAYFITIVCKDRVHWFGEITNGVMHLNDAGLIAQEEWLRTAELREQVSLDAFVIMPNHMHGILLIGNPLPALAGIGWGAPRGALTTLPVPPRHLTDGPQPNTIGTILRLYKQACTIRIRTEHPEFTWLRGYHDHIIRNQDSYNRIRQYIIENPQKWAEDGYF